MAEDLTVTPELQARARIAGDGLHALHAHMQTIDPTLTLRMLPNTGVPVVDTYGILGRGETGETFLGANVGPHIWVQEQEDVRDTMFGLLPMEIVLTGRIAMTATVYGSWGLELTPVTPHYVEVLLLDDGKWVWVGPRNKTGAQKWPTYDLFTGIVEARERRRARDATWAKLLETDTAPWIVIEDEIT